MIKLLLASSLWLMSFGAWAQGLTPAQLATMCTAVKANPTANALRITGDGGGMRGWLNQTFSPAWVVWKPSVPTLEIGQAVNYVAVAAMTATNLERVNTFMRLNPNTFNPARADIRTYMSDTFSGALGGQGQATRDALDALYRRSATNAERQLATGAGTTQDPGVLVFAGAVVQADANWLVNPATCF